MVNTPDAFRLQVKTEIKRRGLTVVRVALDLGENPVALQQLLGGYRKYTRLRAKVAEYLGIPDAPSA